MKTVGHIHINQIYWLPIMVSFVATFVLLKVDTGLYHLNWGSTFYNTLLFITYFAILTSVQGFAIWLMSRFVKQPVLAVVVGAISLMLMLGVLLH
jgi:hypothetical protein